MRVFSLVAWVALVSAAPIPPVPQDWLQIRMDRIAAAAGLNRSDVHAVLSDDVALNIERRGSVITIPRALVSNAPSAQAVDGILSMLLSYQWMGDTTRNRSSLGEVAAFGALIAATGGISEDKSTKVVSLDGDDRPRGSVDDRSKARRGVRWLEAASGCPAALTGYLRTLARGPIDDGLTIPARRILTDLGALAYPPEQPCRIEHDDDFVMVQEQLKRPS